MAMDMECRGRPSSVGGDRRSTGQLESGLW
jgi:hypothetical protein